MTATETKYTQSQSTPYFFAPNDPLLKKLMVVAKFYGATSHLSYSDSTRMKLKLIWVDSSKGKTKPFDYDKEPSEVISAIRRNLTQTKNPWLGCYYHNEFLGGEKDEVFYYDVFPIGD